MKRGVDIFVGGVHLPRLVDESGARYILWADVPVDGNGSVEGRYISIEGGVLSFADVVVPSALYDGKIILFDCDNYEEYACPEALDWLCRNYGLAFSPAGLYVFVDSGGVYSVYPYKVTRAACLIGNNIFILASEEDDITLRIPHDSSTVLGCDGSYMAPLGGTQVLPSGILENIRSTVEVEFQAAYNTWLFYLASGLPKSVFEDL